MKKYKLLIRIQIGDDVYNAGRIETEEFWNNLGFYNLEKWGRFEPVPVPNEPQALDKNDTPLAVEDLVTSDWGNVGKITKPPEILGFEIPSGISQILSGQDTFLSKQHIDRIHELESQLKSAMLDAEMNLSELKKWRADYFEEKKKVDALQIPKVAPFVVPECGARFWFLDTSFTNGVEAIESEWSTRNPNNYIFFNTEADALLVAAYLNKILVAIRGKEDSDEVLS